MLKIADQNVPLALTEAERNVILRDLIYVEKEYASVIRATPSDQPIRFSLDDWKSLCGCIAAEANQARNKRLKTKLDRLHARIRSLLGDDKSPTALKDLSWRR